MPLLYTLAVSLIVREKYMNSSPEDINLYPLKLCYQAYDIYALGSINGPVGDEIRRLKANQSTKSSFIKALVSEFYHSHLKETKMDYITFIPSNKNRHFMQDLAEQIGQALNLPVLSVIEFQKNIREQKIIESYEKRYENVAEAFQLSFIPNPVDNIMIVDDVYASGATLKEVLNLFYKNNCLNIVSVVFAYRHMSENF